MRRGNKILAICFLLFLTFFMGCEEETEENTAVSFDYFRDYEGFGYSLYNSTIKDGSPYFGVSEIKYSSKYKNTNDNSYNVTESYKAEYNPDGTVSTELLKDGDSVVISNFTYEYNAVDGTFTATGIVDGNGSISIEGTLDEKKLVTKTIESLTYTSTTEESGENQPTRATTITESTSETAYDGWKVLTQTNIDNDLNKTEYTYTYNESLPKSWVCTYNGENSSKIDYEVKDNHVTKKVITSYVKVNTDDSTDEVESEDNTAPATTKSAADETDGSVKEQITGIYTYSYNDSGQVSKRIYYSRDSASGEDTAQSQIVFTWENKLISKIENFTYSADYTTEELVDAQESWIVGDVIEFAYDEKGRLKEKTITSISSYYSEETGELVTEPSSTIDITSYEYTDY